MALEEGLPPLYEVAAVSVVSFRDEVVVKLSHHCVFGRAQLLGAKILNTD